MSGTLEPHIIQFHLCLIGLCTIIFHFLSSRCYLCIEFLNCLVTLLQTVSKLVYLILSKLLRLERLLFPLLGQTLPVLRAENLLSEPLTLLVRFVQSHAEVPHCLCDDIIPRLEHFSGGLNDLIRCQLLPPPDRHLGLEVRDEEDRHLFDSFGGKPVHDLLRIRQPAVLLLTEVAILSNLHVGADRGRILHTRDVSNSIALPINPLRHPPRGRCRYWSKYILPSPICELSQTKHVR